MLDYMNRLFLFVPVLWIAACQSGIYVRDGVTDGDAFYLAPQAMADDDPVVGSWVRYSLIRSTCQLEVGGENPARVSTYDCELTARRHLVEAWRERSGYDEHGGDAYLDALTAVDEMGFLPEYTVHYFGKDEWQVPDDLDTDAFDRWRRKHLRGHRPRTRLVGYWGYRKADATITRKISRETLPGV